MFLAGTSRLISTSALDAVVPGQPTALFQAAHGFHERPRPRFRPVPASSAAWAPRPTGDVVPAPPACRDESSRRYRFEAAPRFRMPDLKTKFVFFGWHTDMLERLHKVMANYNPVMTRYTGDKARAHAIDQFQHNPNCRVFVGQIKACGTAVTLTAGTECVFLECAWTPVILRSADCIAWASAKAFSPVFFMPPAPSTKPSCGWSVEGHFALRQRLPTRVGNHMNARRPYHVQPSDVLAHARRTPCFKSRAAP